MTYNELPDVDEPRDSRGSSVVTPADVAAEAERQGVDPKLALSVAKNESAGNPRAVSPKGARGVMQVMPDTGRRMARKLGEKYDPSDVHQNYRLGVALLKDLGGKYGDDYDKVTAAYNAGDGAVDRYGGIPPYKETRNYVRKVKSTYNQLPDVADKPAKPAAKTLPATKAAPAVTSDTSAAGDEIDYGSGLPNVVLPVKKVELPDVPGMSKPVNSQTGKPASQNRKSVKPGSYQPSDPQEAAVLTRAKLINAVGKLREQAPAYGKSLDGLQAEIEAAFSDVQKAPGTADVSSVVNALSGKLNGIVKTINTDQARRRAIQQQRMRQQQAAQQQAAQQQSNQPASNMQPAGPTAADAAANPLLAKMNAMIAPAPNPAAQVVEQGMQQEQQRKAAIDAGMRKPIKLGVDPTSYRVPTQSEMTQAVGQPMMEEAHNRGVEELVDRGRAIEQAKGVKQGFVGNLATGFARGAVNASLDIPEGVATLAGASIPKPKGAMTPELREFMNGAPARVRETLINDLGMKGARDWTAENLKGDGARSQGVEGFAGRVAEGAGSVVPFALGTLLTRGGSLAAAQLGALQNAASTFQDAKQKGASDDAAFGASRIGALIGVSESIGLPQSLEKLGLSRPLIHRAMEVGEEGGQEALSQWLNNVNAAILTAYDPNQGLMEGVLEAGVIGAIISGGTQGLDLAASGHIYNSIKNKLASTHKALPTEDLQTAAIDLSKQAVANPQVAQVAQAVSTAQGQVEQLTADIAEDQKRWKRGEVPVNGNAPVQLQQAQVELATAQQGLDIAVNASIEPATKDISQLTPVAKLAALTSEQIKSGKTLAPIPADATLDQVKDIYRQRVQDFGTDSVAAAEAWAKVRELSPEVQLQAGKDRFYGMPDADALLNRLGNEIATPKGIKEIDAFIRKNKIIGLTAEDIAGDYLSKDQAEQDDLHHEFEKMGLPTSGVVEGGKVTAVPANIEGKPDTGGRVINLEAELEAERQKIAATAEGKRASDAKEAQMLAELEQRAKDKAAAKAQADEQEKIRIAEQEKAEKEAQKLQAKEQEAQRIRDEKLAAQTESQSLVSEHRQRYTDALGQNDYTTAARSLKQIEAQMKFQLREKPTTPAEAATYAEREADLEDVQKELQRLQKLQQIDVDNGKKELPKGPLFSDMANDPEYQAQQKKMDRVEADRKWMNLAAESKTRNLTDEEKVALKNPIEYLKHATMREGIKVGASGERALLGAKESGIVGLTNQGSRFSTADAQVMLDEGGFALPDGRRFTDPSVTENDVIDYLINHGKTATSENADLDAQLAAEEAAYYAKKQAAEEAGHGKVSDHEQQANIDAELAEFDDRTSAVRSGENIRDGEGSGVSGAASGGGMESKPEVAPLGANQADGGREPFAERATISPFVRLRDANTDRINQLRQVGVGSAEGKKLVQALYDYAKAQAIEAKHVGALVSDLMNDEFAAAAKADQDARQILGETKYNKYSERIDNADEDFERITDRIARGFETPQVERAFIQASKRAGFTFAEAQEILRRARQIARRSQESAARAKKTMDSRRARGRRAEWAAESQRLTETYGGTFLDDDGHEVNARIFSRTGRNQVVVELTDSAGDVFDRFTTSEHYLEAGLLGRLGLDSIGRSRIGLSGFERMDNLQLRQAVGELNQLIYHGYEEIRAAQATGDIARVTELEAKIKDWREYLDEGQLQWDHRGMLPRIQEPSSKYRNPEWMALTPAERRAENQRLAREWAAKVDDAAHEAATSPTNDKAEPTDGQKEAGNYSKGHVRIHGLDISIENPTGSKRSGVDPDGKPWEVEMTAHYGYIRKTEGADAEQIDVYIGDHPQSERVFVVDQVDADTSKFDEHKVILNAADRMQAEQLYDAHFSDGKGSDRRGAITEMSLPEFKDWLKNGDNAKPLVFTGDASLSATSSEAVNDGDKSISQIVDEEFDALFGEPKEATPKNPAEELPEQEPPMMNALGVEPKGAKWVLHKLPNGKYAWTKGVSMWDIGEFATVKDAIKAAMKPYLGSFPKLYAEYPTGTIPAYVPPVRKPKAPRTTTEAATSAVKNTAKGLDNIAKGLSELFGGPKFSSGFTFDEKTYKAAKPYFLAAMEHFKEAAGDVREVARRLLTALRDDYQFPTDAIAKMKPYIVKFIEENQSAGTNNAQLLHTFANVEDGIEARVTKTPRGYAVTVFDTDAQETLDSVKIFPNESDAITHAKKLANIKEVVPQAAPISLADHLVARLKGEGFSTIVEARKFAEQVTGQPYRAGTTEAKRLDEMIEAASVKAVREQITELRQAGKTDEQIYAAVRELFDKQPNLNVRTSTSIEQQAYSTPTPLAFVASRLAGINPQTTVYEPTAGNGALLIEARPSRIVANELNPDRAASLRESLEAAQVLQQDATTVQLPDKVDVVIANPPFGVVKGNDGISKKWDTGLGYTTSEVDHAIVFKSLAMMKDDGRAVLIVGGMRGDEAMRKDKYNAGSKKQFYYRLYKNYNVVDHFTINGSMYAKQGAAYPVDVIVIAGKGASKLALPAVSVPKVVENYDELGQKLKDSPRSLGATNQPTVGGHHPGGTKPTTGQQSIFDVPAEPGQSNDPGQRAGTGNERLPESVGDRGAAGHQPATNSGSATAGQRGGTGKAAQSGRDTKTPDRQGDKPAGTEVDRGNDAGSVAGRPVGEPIRTPGLDYNALKEAAKQGAKPTETHRPYEPASSAFGLGSLVPANLSKGSAEALADLHAEVGDVDQYVAEKLGYDASEGLSKYFSAEQVDAIALAINNLEKGKGFIIGDQTGLGKGRVNAAIITYALRNGKTPIFVTEKPKLYGDMLRDLKDIGRENVKPVVTNSDEEIPINDAAFAWYDAKEAAILNGQKVPPRPSEAQFLKTKSGKENTAELTRLMNSEGLGEGRAIFTTYSQMQTVKGQETLRQKFLNNFAARPSILILDESHNAGGGPKQLDEEGKVKMDRAQFVRGLIEKSQGTFYSSATFAKRPEVMDLYSKTDLRLIADNPALLQEIFDEGGVPLQQVASSMLVQSGQMVRRERSFDGIEYNTHVTPVHKESAENVSRSIKLVLDFSEIVQAVVETINGNLAGEGSAGGDNATGDAGATSTNFTSIMHNLVAQMLLSLKADAAAEMAIKHLQEGRKPIITVANTMGSFLEDYVTNQQVNAGEPVNLSFADLLMRYLNRSREYREKDINGKTTVKYLTDEELGAVGLQMYNEAREFIENADLRMPISPIDHVHMRLRQAGYRTGEITGRMHTIDYDGATPTYRPRPTRETSTAAKAITLNRYNEGDLDALVLNQAGATGLSAHASEKYHDQRQRVMIIAQAEANIDTHMQMLGRVNRTGQLVLPIYYQLAADIPAELRPAAVLAKKMASLNANTTGARSSAVTAKEALDFVNKYGDEAAVMVVSDHPNINRMLGYPVKINEEGGLTPEGAVARLTGRLAALPIKEQEKVYALLEESYRDVLAQAEAMGENTLEAKTMKLDAETLKTTEVEAAKGASPFTQAVHVEQARVNILGKPYSTQEVKDKVTKELGVDIAGVNTAAAARVAEMKAMVNAHAQAETDRFAKSVERHKAFLDGLDPDMDPKLIEKAQKAVDKAEREYSGARLRAETYRNEVSRVLNAAPVGSGVSLDSKIGTQSGVVIKIEAPKELKGFGLSSWKLTIAMADSSRELKLKFNQVSVGDGKNAFRLNKSQRAEVYNPATEDYDYVPLLEAFDKAGTLAKEKRHIITGNVMRGFAKFKNGQIVNYTDKEGTIKQGVLMPRKWDAAGAISRQDVRFETVDEAMGYLGHNKARLRDSDNALEVAYSMNRTGILLTVPAAKASGGKFYLNQGLREIVGDFVKSSSKMIVKLDAATTREALEYLTKTGVGGEKVLLYAGDPKHAREVLGLNDAARDAMKVVRNSSEAGYMRPDMFVPHFAVDGLRYIAEGGRKFAEWAAPHLKEFGEKMRPVLRQAWEEAKKFWKDERGVLNLQRVKQLFTPAMQPVAVPPTFDPVQFSKQFVGIVNNMKMDPKKKQAALDAYNAAMMAVGANDGVALKQAQRELKRSLGKAGLVLMDFFRPLMAGGEWSIVGRQGGYHFLAHPVLSGNAFAGMFAAFTEKGYDTRLAELENNPYYEKAKKAGVDFGAASEFEITKSALTGEENFSISLVEKIAHSRVPGFKHAAKLLGSIEQMNKAFLDTQRLNVFAYGAKIIEAAGGSQEKIDAGLKEWAKEVNRASGRGNIHEKYQQATAVAAVGMFSPRFAISRLQLLDPTRFYRAYKQNPAAAKLQMADAVKVLGAAGAIAGLAFLSGASVSGDPDDADFLKAKWGDYRVNILPAGVGSYVKMAARMLKRSANYYESQDTNEIKKALDQLGKFARYKEAPLPSFVHDQLDRHRDKGQWEDIGHNAVGESKTLTRSFLDRVWPIYYQNLVQAAQKEGLMGVAKTLPEALGADSQLYQEKEYVGRPPEPRSKTLSAPVERKIRKETFATVAKAPIYQSLPDTYKAELAERQMSDAVNDAELKKTRSAEFKRLAFQSDAKVVAGLKALHDLPDVKVMDFKQKKAADSAYYKSLQHLRGTRASADREESLPELPDPSDLRSATRAAIKAAREVSK